MSDSSTPSRIRAIDDGTRRSKPARTRQDQRRRERIQVAVVCLVMLMAVGAGGVLAMTKGLPSAFSLISLSERDSLRSGAQARNASEGDGRGGDSAKFGQPQLRSGTIVPMNLRDPCKQLSFDNDTGGVSESAKPCKSEVAVDARGVPVPQGTINRMNAISKAFSSDR